MCVRFTTPPHYFSPIDTQPHPVSVRKPHPTEIPGTSSVATDNETQEKRPRANVPGTKSGTYKAYNIYIEPVRYSLSQHDIFQSSNVCLPGYWARGSCRTRAVCPSGRRPTYSSGPVCMSTSQAHAQALLRFGEPEPDGVNQTTSIQGPTNWLAFEPDRMMN